jgi:hypothetical protein
VPPANPKKNSSPSLNPKNRPSKNPNNQNNPNNPKKQWAGPVFTKISKKYEELNSKPIEEPKEGEGDEVKAEFIKAKNFQIRIRSYLREINQLIENFSRSGYCLFKEDVPRSRMSQLCEIITAGSAGRLKDISL